MTALLTSLAPGMLVPFGGDRVASVSPDLAQAFKAGDRLIVVQDTGDLLHVPAAVQAIAAAAVRRAHDAFAKMGAVTDDAITAFFAAFADKLADETVWARIAAANAADVERALARGRSTTRLKADAKMRAGMIDGLRLWQGAGSGRGTVAERVEHDGWTIEQVVAPLGVVGFVFEGRPNVFADAAGVLRGGNTVVFRIGSDALGTARAIVADALDPALAEAGLPAGACSLVESAEHAAGWAMFADSRLALAVARGSGAAVAQLGAVARQAGTPVSLHGTGGAWMVAAASADAQRFAAVAERSLDRKVCNTLNVCCIVRARAAELVPLFLAALERAGGARGCKLHIVEGDTAALPAAWHGRAEVLMQDALGKEWEWEDAPEVTLKIVESVEEAVDLFNRYSPQFIASLISEDRSEHDRFYGAVNAPFVADGFTRFVDGQYAFNRPELGLSNWENGRLFARGGVLAGDGVFTLRARVTQSDPTLAR
jgi:glutamate-5-semialdehyde dehydrogenase